MSLHEQAKPLFTINAIVLFSHNGFVGVFSKIQDSHLSNMVFLVSDLFLMFSFVYFMQHLTDVHSPPNKMIWGKIALILGVTVAMYYYKTF